jgi:hypothetical protein
VKPSAITQGTVFSFFAIADNRISEYGFGSGETPGVWCTRREVGSPFAAGIHGPRGQWGGARCGRSRVGSAPGSWHLLEMWSSSCPEAAKSDQSANGTNQRGPPAGTREGLGAAGDPPAAAPGIGRSFLQVTSRFGEHKTAGVWSVPPNLPPSRLNSR